MKIGEDPVEQFDATVPTAPSSRRRPPTAPTCTPAARPARACTVNLVVSVGALPPIQGMSFDDAKSALSAASELDVASGPQEDYNDTVPEGQVIGIVETGVDPPGRRCHCRRLEGPAVASCRRSSG